MINISANELVTMVRGDSFSIPLFINFLDKLHLVRYELIEGDVVQFRVMPAHCPWEDSPIQKEYTKEDVNEDGDIIVSFVPEDTEPLEPGKYYYEVKLIHEHEDYTAVNTLITRRQFMILG